jgi:DNA-binding response OmpR family regulator
MSSEAKILIVDDEANIRASLEEMLTRDGHETVAVESGEAALDLIQTHKFDLALIDLKLTGIGGIEVLTALRQQSPGTISIVLTAYASLKTAIEALRQGAHDYLFKPCKPEELRESIRKGLLKRQQRESQDLLRHIEQMADDLEEIRTTLTSGQEPPSLATTRSLQEKRRFLQLGTLIVDLLRHVITVDDQVLDLSPTEFALLAYLVGESPRVVSPQELVQEVQGYDSEEWEARETIRQHIYRTRQKIRDATGRTDIIRTVRGVGYTIAE